jgi:hypothetical protein
VVNWSQRARADGIKAAPLGGRKVPELNDEQVREIPAYSWRILYHLREGHCRASCQAGQNA